MVEVQPRDRDCNLIAKSIAAADHGLEGAPRLHQKFSKSFVSRCHTVQENTITHTAPVQCWARIQPKYNISSSLIGLAGHKEAR